MHAETSKRARRLTSAVTVRLLPDELERIDATAREAGLSKSEWIRKVTLAAAKGGDMRLLLGELLVNRSVTVTILAELAAGRRMTADAIKTILADLEARKGALADSRIASMRAETSQ